MVQDLGTDPRVLSVQSRSPGEQADEGQRWVRGSHLCPHTGAPWGISPSLLLCGRTKETGQRQGPGGTAGCARPEPEGPARLKTGSLRLVQEAKGGDLERQTRRSQVHVEPAELHHQ